MSLTILERGTNKIILSDKGSDYRSSVDTLTLGIDGLLKGVSYVVHGEEYTSANVEGTHSPEVYVGGTNVEISGVWPNFRVSIKDGESLLIKAYGQDEGMTVRRVKDLEDLAK